MWWLILIGGAIFLASKSNFQQLSNQLQYRFDGLDIDRRSTNLFNTVFNLKFVLTNPTTASITVDSISGTLFTGEGQSLGNFNKLTPTIIPARGTVNVPIQLTVGNWTTATTFLNLLQNNQARSLTIKYNINVGGLSIPVEQKVA